MSINVAEVRRDRYRTLKPGAELVVWVRNAAGPDTLYSGRLLGLRTDGTLDGIGTALKPGVVIGCHHGVEILVPNRLIARIQRARG